MKNRKTFYVIALLFGLAAAALAVCALLCGGNAVRRDPAAGLDELLRYDGWQLIRADGSPEPVDPPVYRNTPGARTVRLVNTLPRALESGAYLAFESVNTYVEVRVDGELIYQNTDPGGARPRAMWNYIPLDSVWAEGRVAIEFSGPDAYDVGIIPEILMGSRAEILLLANARNALNTQLSLSVLFLGVLVLLFSLVTYTNRRFVSSFILLGLFICLLGGFQLLRIVPPTGSLNLGRLIPGLSAPLRVICCVLFEGGCGLWLRRILCRGQADSRKYRLLVSISLAALMLGTGLEGFTHLGYTAMRVCRPMVLGSLVFALLQAVAAMFYAYDHVERQAKMARELSESRVALMMNQLKPHFIRNSLATIRAIIRHDPEKAYDLLYDFSKYLTYNIDVLKGTVLTTFTEELGHIREYTALEREHMLTRLRVEYDIGPTDFAVPPLSVQPFVENAVKHGVWPKEAGGTVRIATSETEEAYIITVTDDGVGYDPGASTPAKPGHGVGIKTAAYRLETMVGGEVRTESVPGKGTAVTITIPKGKTEE